MPPALDAGVIRQKLDAIEGSLSTLESISEVTSARLAEDPVVGAAVERLVSRVVDLAVEVNSHIVAAVSKRGPGEYSESFRMAAKAGVFDAATAAELVGSVGMRNVIVHQYIQLDLEIIAAAIPKAIEQYRSYVSAVAAFVVDLEGDGGRDR
jgi:uncharacterized protein YutE (UPF0331/DUF86 family)